MAELQSPFSTDFGSEELYKAETQSLEAEQRQAANDAGNTHVVVTVTTTT